ncbi:MAG: amino acid ABC transporter ATP-binding protein [Clostridia bacterium]|nr:amino acid ABC transporter ATP-binding protein [Clostridia bacterium]
MALLSVNQLKKSFGKVDVLKGISFDVEQGEVISIIGSSGSGKTTLFRCLNFLERADEGNIVLDGKMIFDGLSHKTYSAKEMREKQLNFGLVFQNFNLFPQYTALENVTLAMKLLAKDGLKSFDGDINTVASSYLSRVGLGDKLSFYPCQLSGGQQQRVAIARALALNPKILFFDEPTSALDPLLTNEVLSTLKSLAKENMTMIIVTHEMKFAKDVSTKVIYMDGGYIVESGTPEQIFENPKQPQTRSFLSSFIETEQK